MWDPYNIKNYARTKHKISDELEILLYFNARIFNDFYFSTFNPLWKLQFVIQFKKCWFSL